MRCVSAVRACPAHCRKCTLRHPAYALLQGHGQAPTALYRCGVGFVPAPNALPSGPCGWRHKTVRAHAHAHPGTQPAQWHRIFWCLSYRAPAGSQAYAVPPGCYRHGQAFWQQCPCGARLFPRRFHFQAKMRAALRCWGCLTRIFSRPRL